MSRDDEMITIGGGEIDEMELLVRKLRKANEMVEELPVIDSDEEQPAADEPIEITLGGDSDDSGEDDDDSDEDDDDSYEDDDDFDEDDDDFDEDDDDSDEDDDDSDEDDEDFDEDDDDFDEDDDDFDEDDDDSDEDDDDFDEDDDDFDEDDDDSDEDDNDFDEDDDDFDEDDDDFDEDDDDSDEDDDIVIGGDADEEELSEDDSDEYSDPDDEDEDEDAPVEDEGIVIGGDSEEEVPAEEAVPEETPQKTEKKPQSKNEQKSSKKDKTPPLPVAVIGPRDLDKMRAARAEAKKRIQDSSFNSEDEQDFQKHLLVSASPHLHCGETTKIVMQDVIVALLPALAVSFIYYGWRALMLTAVCVLSCVLTEYVCRRVMNRRQTISDYSAAVTGILLAFCLPAELNPLFAVVGSLVAIVVVKQMFGGIGSNFANPAATARIVLMLSFPAAMTTFSKPFSWMGSSLDTVTSATPLVDPDSYSKIDLLLGVHGGSLGETCSIALLLGGAYLLLRKVISWHIPVAFIGTTAVLSLLFGMDPIAQICSGGLLLGAFFMATDYVTSPVNKRGQLVFGIGCGLLTIIIRRFGAMAEGVSFAILLMNILTPLIERVTTPKPFGEEDKQA